jgi:hypothetical protein
VQNLLLKPATVLGPDFKFVPSVAGSGSSGPNRKTKHGKPVSRLEIRVIQDHSSGLPLGSTLRRH